MIKSLELVELDDDELDNRLAQSSQELFNLRFQLATGRLDNSARIREVKRDVARILTEMRARELGGATWAERSAVQDREHVRPAPSGEEAGPGLRSEAGGLAVDASAGEGVVGEMASRETGDSFVPGEVADENRDEGSASVPGSDGADDYKEMV